MCEYVSFVVDDDGRVYAGTLKAHEGIAEGWDLRPGTYREAEWTADDPATLTVRTEPDDAHDEGWYRALVLATYPTRDELLVALTRGRTDRATYHYQRGELHRMDGPAVEYADGTREWWIHGELHRTDGPAVEYACGTREWWVRGKQHRTGGPAIEWAGGTREWWVRGKRHRMDGPAIEYADGTREWWVHGKRQRIERMA